MQYCILDDMFFFFFYLKLYKNTQFHYLKMRRHVRNVSSLTVYIINTGATCIGTDVTNRYNGIYF